MENVVVPRDAWKSFIRASERPGLALRHASCE